MEQTHADPDQPYRFVFYMRMSSSQQSACSLNRLREEIEVLVKRLGDSLVRVVYYTRISLARS
jgi:hypothetical protein